MELDKNDNRKENKNERSKDAQNRHFSNQRRNKPILNVEKEDNSKKISHKNIHKILVSVVIPLLNEEESLPELSKKLEEELPKSAGQNYEIIYIDDGSTDNSWETIKDIKRKNNRISGIRFRKNHGKSAALAVGFAKARGEYVVTMDADLQDDPQEIQHLIAKLRDGYDLVSGWKKIRHDPISKTIPSKFFNFVTSIFSGIKLHDFNCGLKAYRKEVVKSLEVYGELHRYLPAMAHIQGFKVTEIPVEHHARKYGKSKFGASRLIKGFLDLLTMIFTSKFARRPLHFFGTLGVLFVLAGTIIDAILIFQWFEKTTFLSNRPLAFFGMGLIIVGVQLFSMGLLGEMIAKEGKMKMNYNIKERL